MFGSDISSSPRDLQIQIVRTFRHGTLSQSASSSSNNSSSDGGGEDWILGDTDLLRGFIPAGHYSGQGLEVSYRSDEHYFNSPTTTWGGATVLNTSREFIDFKMLAADGAESMVSRLFITVQNVNDPCRLYMKNSEKKLEVYALSDAESGSDIESAVSIFGFSIDDPDQDVDVIKASVSTRLGGVISLNPDHMDDVDFNSDALCFGPTPWLCRGDGSSEAEMVFVGTPSAVQAVLNGMVYQSTLPDIEDTIDVALYDGEVRVV